MEDYISDSDLPTNQSSKTGGIILLILLAVFNLPALIIGYLVYFILFIGLKWKPVISSILVGFLSLLWYILVKVTDPFSIFILMQPKTWLIPYLFLNVILGLLGGIMFIHWNAGELKRHPELKDLPGLLKDFKYAETPYTTIKRKILKKECEEGKLNSYEAAPMGVLEEPVKLDGEQTYDKVHTVYRTYTEANKTTWITGMPGSGKTLTMLNLMRNDILAGYPICVIDFKKGPDMAYFLSKWAKENDRRFYHFTSGTVGSYKNPFCKYQASYDPLSTGTATSKADMVLNMRKWDGASEVYKSRTQSIVQSIFYLLENVDRNAVPRIPWEQGGIAQFVAAIEVTNLFDLIEQYKKELSLTKPSTGDLRKLQELQNLYADLTSTGRKSLLREQLDGLAIMCRTLIMSNYSDWLAKGETPNHINLFEICTSKDAPVVLFQFNPNEEPEFSKIMGSIILNDIKRASAYKNSKGDKTPFGLYVDEAQTLDPLEATGIAEKTRSANFFSTFSTQTLDQLLKEENGSDAVLTSIMGSISNFIVHSGSTEDAALRYSKVVGKTMITKRKSMSKRNSGLFAFNWRNSRHSMVNTDKVEEYKILPREFQTLSSPNESNGYKSTAFYITTQCSDKRFSKRTETIARKFQSVVNKDILEEVPYEFKKNLLTAGLEARPTIIKELNEVHNADEVLYQDNIFKIEEIDEDEQLLDLDEIAQEENNEVPQEKEEAFDSSSNNFLETNDNLQKQQQMTDRQFAKENKRENLEPKRKKTSFELMQEKRGVKKVEIKEEKSNNKFKGLPEL